MLQSHGSSWDPTCGRQFAARLKDTQKDRRQEASSAKWINEQDHAEWVNKADQKRDTHKHRPAGTWIEEPEMWTAAAKLHGEGSTHTHARTLVLSPRAEQRLRRPPEAGSEGLPQHHRSRAATRAQRCWTGPWPEQDDFFGWTSRYLLN